MSAPDSGLDRLLDRSIVPGYSALGYHLRRRSWAPDDPAPNALAGRRALVTGAGSGLGQATALGLAQLGASVHLLVRSVARATPAVDRIRAALAADGVPADLVVEECDVSDLDAVRTFSADFTARLTDAGSALDVLIHNAGVLPARRTESVDGHELTVATHVLGPVLLTELLRPALAASASGSRVVFVASGGMYTQSLPTHDPEFMRGRYDGAVAYARSKRMQVELTPILAERWAADGVSVYAMHPGWADTPGVASSLPLFRALTRPILRSASAGADTVIWLAATDPAPPTGFFWHDRQRRPSSYRATTVPGQDEVETMWEWVREAISLE